MESNFYLFVCFFVVVFPTFERASRDQTKVARLARQAKPLFLLCSTPALIFIFLLVQDPTDCS